jgi:hypothetical protein
MHNMKAYGLVDVCLHSFLPPALHGDEWLTLHPDHFAPVPYTCRESTHDSSVVQQ